MESIFTFKISHALGPQYVPMADDIARFVMIQVVIQTLLFTLDSKAFPIFSADFILLIMFIVSGVMFYHLVFKKLVQFV